MLYRLKWVDNYVMLDFLFVFIIRLFICLVFVSSFTQIFSKLFFRYQIITKSSKHRISKTVYIHLLSRNWIDSISDLFKTDSSIPGNSKGYQRYDNQKYFVCLCDSKLILKWVVLNMFDTVLETKEINVKCVNWNQIEQHGDEDAVGHWTVGQIRRLVHAHERRHRLLGHARGLLRQRTRQDRGRVRKKPAGPRQEVHPERKCCVIVVVVDVDSHEAGKKCSGRVGPGVHHVAQCSWRRIYALESVQSGKNGFPN